MLSQSFHSTKRFVDISTLVVISVCNLLEPRKRWKQKYLTLRPEFFAPYGNTLKLVLSFDASCFRYLQLEKREDEVTREKFGKLKLFNLFWFAEQNGILCWFGISLDFNTQVLSTWSIYVSHSGSHSHSGQLLKFPDIFWQNKIWGFEVVRGTLKATKSEIISIITFLKFCCLHLSTFLITTESCKAKT